MKAKFGLLGVGIFVGVTLMLAGWILFPKSYTYQGSLINPPAPAADFQLTDQNGKPFRLSDQRGKVVLIFFGYTHCPDVCPITLTEFKQIREALGDKAQQVDFVFITVDPERDTQEVLRSHLANFDPTIYGLSGSPAELEAVYKSYGVYRSLHTEEGPNYSVDHTSLVYAIDKQGNWRLTYPFGMEAEKMNQDVLHLIQEKTGL